MEGFGKIFIQIAAYRDPELKHTIRDCLEKARFPSNLVFSICWQHNKHGHMIPVKGPDGKDLLDPQGASVLELADQWDNLDEWKDDPRFKIVDIDYTEAKGPCYARNLLQQNYAGEEYTLQIDSHARFAQDWDEILVTMLKNLQNRGHKKPLITSYAPEYHPSREPEGRNMTPLHLVFDRFTPEGIMHLKPHSIDDWNRRDRPVPARIYSAHFAFTIGDFVLEVPHDPKIYFHGEEPSIGIRAFTHGYDLFHPHRLAVWHYYGRPVSDGYRRHWDDADITTLVNNSYKRFRELFGVWGQGVEDFGKYGLGRVRSLEQYERYAGMRFRDLTVQKYTLDCHYPPNPHYALESDWEESLLPFYRHCIDIRYDQVPDRDQYDFWVVAFIAADGNDVPGSRRDADRNEIDGFFNDKDGYCKIWRDFIMPKDAEGNLIRPVKWRVWPHKKDGTFADRIEGSLVHDVGREVSAIQESMVVAQPPEISISPAEGEGWRTPKEGDPVMSIHDVDPDMVIDTMNETILVHIPAYREPELVNTIKDALANAMNPHRVHFGICRQYNPADGFDNVDEYRNDPRFKIIDVPYEQAKGLPWARAQVNDNLLTDEDYVLQLDSHHRFCMNWDAILISLLNGLEKDGVDKPILTGYSPQYSPITGQRTMEPWMSGFRCFYPAHTIFIGPQGLHGWQDMKKPARARFLCGHFDFARAQWARDVRHDPSILFAGEEINLTVRSFTKGYDFYHPHRIVVWHATMREEREGICKWDDDNKKGIQWWKTQDENRRMIRTLFGIEENPDIQIKPEYGLGTERTVRDYEKFAGLCFKNKTVTQYTADNQYPPNPVIMGDFEEALKLRSYYWEVTLHKGSWPSGVDKVLVAYDGPDGIGVRSDYITPVWDQYERHHYADYFVSDKPIAKVVYWGIKDGQWLERYEHEIK